MGDIYIGRYIYRDTYIYKSVSIVIIAIAIVMVIAIGIRIVIIIRLIVMIIILMLILISTLILTNMMFNMFLNTHLYLLSSTHTIISPFFARILRFLSLVEYVLYFLNFWLFRFLFCFGLFFNFYSRFRSIDLLRLTPRKISRKLDFLSGSRQKSSKNQQQPSKSV